MSTTSRGRHAETIAAAYLALQGFRERRRNLRVGPREIDLIATRDRLLLFVEVKLRTTGRAGPAVLAADRRKWMEIYRAVGERLGELQRRGWRVRFDSVAVDVGRDGVMTVRHYRGAFSPPSSFVG